MEKILQILAVFGLLMLLIWRSMRARGERLRRFSYIGRIKDLLDEEIDHRIIHGVLRETRSPIDDAAAAALWDEEMRLVDEDMRLILSYYKEGKLTIGRRTANGQARVLQEIAVPMDCTGLAWDPQEHRIYLEEAGDWFVYGEED